MIKLEAVYTQQPNGRWKATIIDCPYITVEDAEDLCTAKVFLRIITAEEISQTSRHRVQWDITKEHINYYVRDDDSRLESLKSLL